MQEKPAPRSKNAVDRDCGETRAIPNGDDHKYTYFKAWKNAIDDTTMAPADVAEAVRFAYETSQDVRMRENVMAQFLHCRRFVAML